MVIVLRRCARRAGVNQSVITKEARRVLVHLEEHGSELSISLVDDAEMQQLNGQYRGKDRPTDVLAFAMREGEQPLGDESILGDVIISVETAQRQAAQRQHSLAVEIRTLLVHGILHLLGYDHERSPAEAQRMFAKEREIATLLTSEKE